MVGNESASQPTGTVGPEHVLALFDTSVAEVHAYVWRRCGDRSVAEDITAETFLAAVQQAKDHPNNPLTVGWLITVARSKLLNHWRSREREERRLRLVAGDASDEHDGGFGIDEGLDLQRFEASLRALPASQQAALSLRYLDGLSVTEVATEIGRSVHATESLLARARSNFRNSYLGPRHD